MTEQSHPAASQPSPEPKILARYKLSETAPMANAHIVQYLGGGEFVLSFFDERPRTALLHDKNEWKFQDGEPILVTSVCMNVARIPALIKTLQDGVERFKWKAGTEPTSNRNTKSE
jgi:hypothetical protein